MSISGDEKDAGSMWVAFDGSKADCTILCVLFFEIGEMVLSPGQAMTFGCEK